MGIGQELTRTTVLVVGLAAAMRRLSLGPKQTADSKSQITRSTPPSWVRATASSSSSASTAVMRS